MTIPDLEGVYEGMGGGALRPSGFVPTCAAVLVAALLAGCTVQKAPPREPERFEVVSRTWREGFGTNPTTAALLSDRETGCLYSLAEGKGAAPLLTPDGNHAGCRATPAPSVGTDDRNAGGSENQ